MESPNITITMHLGIITDVEVSDPPPRCHDCKKSIWGLPGRVEHRERDFPSSSYPFPPPAPSSIAYVEWTCLPCVRKNDKWPELPLAKRKNRWRF